MIEYKVEFCDNESLQEMLNWFVEYGFEIDKYEHIPFDLKTGAEWAVVGKKRKVDE